MLFLLFFLFVFRSALATPLIQTSLKLFSHLHFPSYRPKCSLQKFPLFTCFCLSFLPSLLPGSLAHLSLLYLIVVTQDGCHPQFVAGNSLRNRDKMVSLCLRLQGYIISSSLTLCWSFHKSLSNFFTEPDDTLGRWMHFSFQESALLYASHRGIRQRCQKSPRPLKW